MIFFVVNRDVAAAVRVTARTRSAAAVIRNAAGAGSANGRATAAPNPETGDDPVPRTAARDPETRTGVAAPKTGGKMLLEIS